MRVRHVFSCEIGDEARHFNAHNHTPENMFYDVTKRPIPEVRLHLYVAGPPRQSWAGEGKRAGLADAKGRGLLYGCSIDFIVQALPLVAIVENAAQLNTYRDHDGHPFIDNVVARLRRANYTVHRIVINADQCGLPQFRRRLYLVAVHKDAGPGRFPQSEAAEGPP